MTDTTNTGVPGGPEEHEARIAEYVLGTLTGAERVAFEAALSRDAGLRLAVAQWSEHLQPLADAVPAVAPPAALRARIIAAVAPRDAVTEADARPFNLSRWLAWTLGLSLLAGVAAAALVFVFMPRPPELGGYAMLHDATASGNVIAFQVDRDRHDMVVLAAAPQPGAGHDYELWLLPPQRSPISLGVVKAGIREQKPLSAAAVKYLKSGVDLGLSLEPAGGAPNGLPTGPVLFSGVFHPVQ
jgi:anti-sigma-K factor RskA